MNIDTLIDPFLSQDNRGSVRLIQRKFGLGMYPMIALWAVLSFASVNLIGALGITGLHLLIERGGIDASYRSLIFWCFLPYIFFLLFWRCNVYRRIDLVRFAKSKGMTLPNGPSRTEIFFTGWLRSMVRCRLNDIYVIAKIEGAYMSIFGLGDSTEVTFEKLDSINKVGFASLVNIPIAESVEIAIDRTSKTKKELPQTGISEIDGVLADYLEHLNDFRGTIRIERDYICVTVIGGPWFGKRFQERIIKGLDIATRINETLGKKFHFNDWSGLEMKWDFQIQRFALQKEAERHLFS